jgi:hypothetical protein
MADIINLNRARKHKAREVAKATAANNRVDHGRTGADKAAAKIERERAARQLDGARRDTDDGKPEG